MDQKLAEMRKAAAERYRKVPAEEKPQLRLCDACHKPVYDSEVCVVTGFFHERTQNTSKILGGARLDPGQRVITGQALMGAIDASRVKWGPARTQLVKADSTSLGIFQTFCMKRNWKLMRFGILYGRYNAEGKTVEAHCIYEPEQQGSETGFRPLDDPHEAVADSVATALGLVRVGVVCTHQARDANAIVLSGHELLLCAREQSRYGDHCVLITLGPNLETNQINAHAWQVSEQCVNLFRLGILSADGASSEAFIKSTSPLEVAQEEVKGTTKSCIIKEPSQEVDCRWMTGFIAIEAFTSPIVNNTFVRLSRPGDEPPTLLNVHNYMSDPKRNRLRFGEQIADFHLLMFLATSIFDAKVDMPVIAQAILSKQYDALATYEEILKAYIRSVRGN